MPGMNGVELAGEIAGAAGHPVVLTSVTATCSAEGTHGFDLLRKP